MSQASNAAAPATSSAYRLHLIRTMLPVIVAFALSAIDQTVVATAIPTIARGFGGLSLYGWVTGGFLLSATVTTPIWGKIGDLYGHRRTLSWGIWLFVVASLMCGSAGIIPLFGLSGMMQLVISRAIQGIGSGAIYTTSFALVGHTFSPRDRAGYAGLMGMLFAVANLGGPTIGGLLTDQSSVALVGAHVAGWRMIFLLNIPLSALALILLGRDTASLHHASPHGPGLDLWGALLLTTGLFLTMVGLQILRGPQNITVTLLLISAGFVFLALFLRWEKRSASPLMPIGFVGKGQISAASLAGLFSSGTLLIFATGIPIYLQLTMGRSAMVSGLVYASLPAGVVLSGVVSGRVVKATGKVQPIISAGPCLAVVGMLSLLLLPQSPSNIEVIFRLFLVGLGLGPMQSLLGVVAQNAAPPGDQGIASSFIQLSRRFGASIGASVVGSATAIVFANPVTADGSSAYGSSKSILLSIVCGGVVGMGGAFLSVLKLRNFHFE